MIKHRYKCYSVARRFFTNETMSIPNRIHLIANLKKTKEYDVVIIGAGATGAGAALDAAKRGLKVACFEREDFASGLH